MRRPNGRTIYKILMKNRQSTFWGRRAFVTVRLPASVLPVPKPSEAYCKDWGEQVMVGMWVKDLGGGIEEIRSIADLTSGSDPRLSEDKEATIHFLEERRTFYRWLEGTRRTHAAVDVVAAGVNSFKGREHLELDELSVEDITAHKALCDWSAMYLDGVVEAPEGRSTVHDAFLEAAFAAKTHYSSVSEDGRFLHITYSVKWFYKSRARRFCADLKRAFRVAVEHDVDARLIR